MFIQTFSPAILAFTYLDSVPLSNSGDIIDEKSQMNNCMKSQIHRKHRWEMTPRNHLFYIPAARQH